MQNASPPPRLADSFVLSCIDPRLVDDTTRHLDALGMTDRYSEMRIAGAALALVDPARPAWRQAVLENLAASIQLHGIGRVVLIGHRDCGAVNLWAGRTLAADPPDETRTHHELMERAATVLRERHPQLQVELRLMGLDGSVQLLPCAACGPAGPLRADQVTGDQAARGQGGEAPPAASRFADLARLRLEGGAAADARATTALLAEGVGTYGLTAQEAREAVERVRQAQGQPGGSTAERDLAAFLKLRSDRQGRIAQVDVEQGAGLWRALQGNGGTLAQARVRSAGLALAEGLTARPSGIWPFRSTTWLDRMAEGRA